MDSCAFHPCCPFHKSTPTPSPLLTLLPIHWPLCCPCGTTDILQLRALYLLCLSRSSPESTWFSFPFLSNLSCNYYPLTEVSPDHACILTVLPRLSISLTMLHFFIVHATFFLKFNHELFTLCNRSIPVECKLQEGSSDRAPRCFVKLNAVFGAQTNDGQKVSGQEIDVE